MKNLILVWVLFFMVQNIYCQDLLFETELYFEDAIGNKDTITIGFDTTANKKYNPNLGELNIITSFDSVFEVRASHGLDYQNSSMVLSKTIIGFCELAWPINCYSGEPINIFIHAEHQPIKVKWDRKDFLKSKCTYGSFIHYNFLYEIVDPNAIIFDPEFEYECLGNQDSTYIFIGKEYVQDDGNLEELPYTTVINVDTIYGFQLMLEPSANISPCFVTSNVNIVSQNEDLSIFPNPSYGIFNIHDADDLEIHVFNIQGKMVDVPLINNRIDLSQHESGIYFIKFRIGQKYFTKKVMKID